MTINLLQQINRSWATPIFLDIGQYFDWVIRHYNTQGTQKIFPLRTEEHRLTEAGIPRPNRGPRMRTITQILHQWSVSSSVVHQSFDLEPIVVDVSIRINVYQVLPCVLVTTSKYLWITSNVIGHQSKSTIATFYG